jgi:hypothetical protein
MVPEEPLSVDTASVAPLSEHNVCIAGVDLNNERHNGPAVAGDRVLGGRTTSLRSVNSYPCRVGADGFAVRQLQA